MAKTKRTANPVELLVKFQNNDPEYPLTDKERGYLWWWANAYVTRCVVSHYGKRDRTGEEEIQIDRVLFLYDMLREFRAVTYVSGSRYQIRQGAWRTARACDVRSPLKHPNLILTNYRRAFSNLETVLKLRRSGISIEHFGSWVINAHPILQTLAWVQQGVRGGMSLYDIEQGWSRANPKATPYKRAMMKEWLFRYDHYWQVANARSLTGTQGEDVTAYKILESVNG